MFRNGKSMEQEEEREQRFFIRIIFCGGRVLNVEGRGLCGV